MNKLIDSNKNLALFQEKEIRRTWKYGKWFFVVEDVVEALTDTVNPKDYINKLRKRDEFLREGYGQIVHTLKIETAGGRQKMNCADTRGILRIIQSIPSPKAEPFKQWLAVVGSDRIEEIQNPELAAQRMHRLYQEKGYSKTWIEQRERGIATRNRLTDEWNERGAQVGRDYAILTNEIYQSGFGLSASEYKELKRLPKNRNLRDSMTNMELALTNLGETTAAELHKSKNSIGMKNLKKDVVEAGEVMRKAKNEAEKKLGHSVVSPENYENLEGSKSQTRIGQNPDKNQQISPLMLK